MIFFFNQLENYQKEELNFREIPKQKLDNVKSYRFPAWLVTAEHNILQFPKYKRRNYLKWYLTAYLAIWRKVYKSVVLIYFIYLWPSSNWKEENKHMEFGQNLCQREGGRGKP